MRIFVKDLGILKQAEFEVSDLTIICGANNTGKTYATYALYGFLTFWNEYYSYGFLNEENYSQLLKQGSFQIPLDSISKITKNIIEKACENYTHNFSMVFGANEKLFQNSKFRIQLDDIDLVKTEKHIKTQGLTGKPLYEVFKKTGEQFVVISIVANTEDMNEVNEKWLLRQVNFDILYVLFGDVFPQPFIASIERTGATMFQKELDFTRIWLLDQLSKQDKNIDPFDIFRSNDDRRYALPVKRDVDFIRDLENVTKHESEIAKNHPDIVNDFYVLAGGEYRATKDGIYYVPKNKKVRLAMGESASSVRSLLNLGMYIRHIAHPGDFLMIDEPELNLHPKNQRLMARLLAKLVNVGVKVFITTHSDYILKEINTLIMMKNAGSNAKNLMQHYKYEECELLDAGRITAYIAKCERIIAEGDSTKKNHNTILSAPIGMQGIEISEFDVTIDIMNEIQDQLLYGGDLL